LVIAAVMAVGANLSPLWYVAEYSQDSIRGGSELTADPGEPAREKGLDLEYATGWSYGIDETFNMYIPYLKGGSSEGNFSDDGPVATALSQYGAQRMATSLPSYFGTQPMTAGPTYVGAVAVFLAVLAMFMLRRRWTLWVALVSLLAITLSWGHNFMWLTKLFFYWFPGYNKFRVVAMILVIVEWSVPFLGALAIHKLWKSASPDEGVAVSGAKTSPAAKTTTKPDTERIYKGLKYSVAVLGALSLFFIVFGGSIFDFSSPSDVEILYSQARYGGLDDGQAMQFVNSVAPAMQTERAQMMRADAWRSLAFMVLAAGVVFAFARSKIRRGVMVALLAALVCVDMVVVNMRFLPKEKFVEERQSAFVPTQADLQILSDTEPGFRVLNLTVSPWNDATTSYFHRSLGGYHGAKMQRYQDVIDRYLGKMDMGVLNMLNTKYVIQRDQRTGEPVPAVNPDANGAAWFVETAISVANADEEIAMLGKIDNKREAVVDERFAHLLTATTTTADSTSYIRLTDYKPNHLTYEYDASDETYAVFSEIYYDKGWQAYIDGQPKEHFRVNYILRGMVLPAGRHTVEFRFRAENFSAVSNITLIFSLLIIVSLVAAIAAAALCNRRKDAGEQETAA
ncbi:YfhO family protein, partial [Alistipes sp. OttesenSCG-928-B03]|nr:YfhO family protein [Alistipes sp. OttesenSCG-928-B03]